MAKLSSRTWANDLRQQRERRATHLAELAAFSRDPTPLATLARRAGWRVREQTIVEFLCGLQFQASTPEQAKLLSALLIVVASGNDATALLGIEPAKAGHRRKLPYLSVAAHEIAARVAEGDGFNQAVLDVAEITKDDPEALRRYYFASRRKWPQFVKDAYEARATRLRTRR